MLGEYESILYELAELITDNFLWQMVKSPTRGANILELMFTNIPHHVRNVCVFDDIFQNYYYYQIYLKDTLARVQKLILVWLENYSGVLFKQRLSMRVMFSYTFTVIDD